ncbi:MAG TPA: methionyl-tRNA formyltransferase [Eubacteriaceae bacterium]|nr:methionyl-tRNA formyltransferase [Eubacteriaceae bacterium]
MKVVFMGTPEFSVPVLKALHAHHEVVLVITQPDKPNRRGNKVTFSPVKEYAQKNELPIHQPKSLREKSVVDEIASFKPDVIVVVAYGQLLPKEILNMPPYGCINIHASLLPKYRGAAPIHRAILENEQKTGLSAMIMNEGMDTGDVIHEVELEIEENMTVGELHDRLSEMAGSFILETFEKMENNRVKRIKQSDQDATYASKIDRETGKVDFRKTTTEVHNIIRGTDPYPGAYALLEGKKVKLFDAIKKEDSSDCEPGTIRYCDSNGLWIKTADGAVVVRKIQFPGKKALRVEEYLRGNENLIGKRFEP